MYFEQNQFLRPYCPSYPEFEDFCTENNYHTFNLKSKLGGVRIKVELFNIERDELYFPRIKWVASVHSALHSLGMLIHVQKKYDFNHHGFALHEVPRLTHVGDREFTSYYTTELKAPLVILSREENTANTLERNGAPKIGAINGRWCSRTEKIEPKRLFFERYFFPVEQKIEYVFSKKELLHILDKQSIPYPSRLKSEKKERIIAFVKDLYREQKITSKFKSRYLTQDDSYQRSEFNAKTRKWEPREEPTDRITLYEKVRDERNRIETYREYGVRPIDSIVEFVGIMKSQSPSRALQNPNVKISNISSARKQFWSYEHYPIFHLGYQELQKLTNFIEFKRNPYEERYRGFVNRDKGEVRFGCALCPYKSESFYQRLEGQNQEIYYFSRFLKLLASAKNLITEKREYYYFQTSEII